MTYDSGKSWIENTPPDNGTSRTLIDFYMHDEENGILILNNSNDNNFPIIYATKDGTKTWQEVTFEYFNLPDEITYLVDIDSIIIENGEYKITLGQGNNGTWKAIFKVRDLTMPWLFINTKNQNIHTVG